MEPLSTYNGFQVSLVKTTETLNTDVHYMGGEYSLHGRGVLTTWVGSVHYMDGECSLHGFRVFIPWMGSVHSVGGECSFHGFRACIPWVGTAVSPEAHLNPEKTTRCIYCSTGTSRMRRAQLRECRSDQRTHHCPS